MSLKKFHIFFIVIAGLLCVGMILWGVYYFKISGQWTGFLFSGLGAIGTVLLYRYLRWFLEKYSKFLSVAASLTLLGISSYPHVASACATCYQDPDSPLTKAAVMGVWFLLAVIVSVLLSIIFIARGWLKRARQLKMEL